MKKQRKKKIKETADEFADISREMLDLTFRYNHQISQKEVKDKEGLNRAVYCRNAMKEFNVYGGERLGMVNSKIPEKILGLDGLVAGEVVLIRQADKNSFYVLKPHPVDIIDRKRSMGKTDFYERRREVPSGYIIFIA